MTPVGLNGTTAPGIPPMQVTVRNDGTTRVITISGSLLIGDAWRIREFDLDPAITPVVIDLGTLTELDAAGVAAVVDLSRRLNSTAVAVTIVDPIALEPARVAAMTGTFKLVNQRALLAA